MIAEQVLAMAILRVGSVSFGRSLSTVRHLPPGLLEFWDPPLTLTLAQIHSSRGKDCSVTQSSDLTDN
jgi:hypothetical protein